MLTSVLHGDRSTTIKVKLSSRFIKSLRKLRGTLKLTVKASISGPEQVVNKTASLNLRG